MSNVIRKDVIEIGFNIEDNPIQKLTDEINKIKSVLTGAMGEDVFSDMAKEAKKAQEGVKGINDEAKKAGSSSGIKKLKSDIQNTVKSLTGGEKGVKGFVNALKNISRISLSKLKSGLQTIGTKLTEIAKKAGGAAFNGLKKLAGISFKALGAGLVAAATAVGKLVYDAASAFGEYEQLKGGMEKIFDQADTSAILTDANEAYRNLGMSANEYLRVINDTGATFASTMGDQKGYETAKLGLTAISDYATGTGKSIDVLSEKFTMITRSTSSYQSIADQFSGILPATSKDFLKQAQAAGFLSKKYGELTKVPVAEYQEAVAKMLENGVADLGLAGNTLMEAEKTFTGSLGMMKASWKNLVAAIGTGENLDQCFENFISSAETFGVQLIPVLERSLDGIGIVVDKLAPKIEEKLPGLIEKLLPPVIKAATSLVAGLIKALPQIISTLAAQLPGVFGTLGKSISETLGAEFPILDKFGETISKNAGKITKAIPVILGLVVAFKAFKGIKSAVSGVGTFAKSISTITKKVTGGLGGKLKETASGMSETGNAAKTSSSSMLSAAKSFMMIGVGVLLVAVGFGILAQSAVALASAGPLAIGVMFGLVVALAALGFGMLMMVKSLGTVGPQAITGAAAMMLLGVGVILVAAGFAILVACATSLASAGGAAIGVFFGMIAAIAVLVAVVALCGGALIAGAVGFVIFSVGLLLCAAAAVVFAYAVQLITPPLLALLPVVALVVTTIVNSIGTVLVNYIRAAGDAISQILESVGNIFIKFGEGVSLIVDSIGGAISGVLNSVAGIFDSIGTAALNAGNGFKLVAEGLTMISSLSIIDIGKALSAVGKGMSEMAKHGEGVTQCAEGMMELIEALTLVEAGFVKLTATVTASMALVLAIVTMTMAQIVSAIKSVNLNSTGQQMMNGLIRGMNSKKAEAVATARSIAQAINKEFDKIQKIKSPSRVWEQKGGYMIQGGINGIEKGMPKLQATAQKAGTMAMPYSKYTPENSVSYMSSRSDNAEYNSYAPQFNFTISGTNDDRAVARKVKRYVKEAIEETFESMSRRNPKLQTI